MSQSNYNWNKENWTRLQLGNDVMTKFRYLGQEKDARPSQAHTHNVDEGLVPYTQRQICAWRLELNQWCGLAHRTGLAQLFWLAAKLLPIDLSGLGCRRYQCALTSSCQGYGSGCSFEMIQGGFLYVCMVRKKLIFLHLKYGKYKNRRLWMHNVR